ncbi:NepR family anti-sigma factor [Cereibacter changlensis]|nr:NepR family anti-sigma factor [Cereibacter changlensis]
MQHQIDENLKRVYEEALVQELPDRFAQLLEQLRQKEEKK